jgi:dCTP deaminase
MLKSDRWIRRMAQEHDMINPYSEKQVSQGVISYGVSSYGYDLRVADEFKIFTNVNCTVVDPKNFDERSFVTVRSDVAIVPPNSFAGAVGRVFQDSTRCADDLRRQVDVCPVRNYRQRHAVRAEWEGFVTLEISNTTPLPARIYANEGLCDPVFPIRRGLRDQLQGQEGKVPGAKRYCVAETVARKHHHTYAGGYQC